MIHKSFILPAFAPCLSYPSVSTVIFFISDGHFNLIRRTKQSTAPPMPVFETELF